MNDQSNIYGVSMRGWICFTLTLGLSVAILLRIPIDTQYFTIINSVLVAYVVNSRPTGNGAKDKPDNAGA